MENLMIIGSNLANIYSLINFICDKIPNIRLNNIACTGMEAIEIIKRENIDIIILDLDLPDINGIEIINFISKNHIKKYISSIIVYTNQTKLIGKIIKNDNVFCYCSKINSIDYIVKKIEKIINKKKKEHTLDNIKNQITIELKKLNFNFSYIGTKYLSECIYECYFKKNKYNFNLSKDIYPIIAKKYNKKISLIGADIFQAILMMFYDTDENILCNYFNCTITQKPKTKDLIIAILQNLY